MDILKLKIYQKKLKIIILRHTGSRRHSGTCMVELPSWVELALFGCGRNRRSESHGMDSSNR